ncbi:helix-turn-helix domain-containing protein [bacterium]|nr:helix-turn-helix domain-containing protein [bacterium]
MQNSNITQRFMDVHDAAIYLGMSESALRYKLDVRRLPFCRIGKSVRLDRIELDKFMSQNSVSPIDLRGGR